MTASVLHAIASAEGDGMTAPLSAVAKWREAVVTPVRVGAPDILGTLGKIGGAVAVKSLGMAASERALGQVRADRTGCTCERPVAHARELHVHCVLACAVSAPRGGI